MVEIFAKKRISTYCQPSSFKRKANAMTIPTTHSDVQPWTLELSSFFSISQEIESFHLPHVLCTFNKITVNKHLCQYRTFSICNFNRNRCVGGRHFISSSEFGRRRSINCIILQRLQRTVVRFCRPLQTKKNTSWEMADRIFNHQWSIALLTYANIYIYFFGISPFCTHWKWMLGHCTTHNRFVVISTRECAFMKIDLIFTHRNYVFRSSAKHLWTIIHQLPLRISRSSGADQWELREIKTT